MRRNLLFVFLLLISFQVFSQSRQLIVNKINDQKVRGSQFFNTNLFRSVSNSGPADIVDAEYFEYRNSAANDLLTKRPLTLNFSIPTDKYGVLEIELVQSNILTPDFKVVSKSNENSFFNYEHGLHYWGIIKNYNSSICAISIFQNECIGIISSPRLGNLNLGKLKDSDQFILYDDKNLSALQPLECYYSGDIGSYAQKDLSIPQQNSINCIRLYWEVNYDIFIDKGSLTNATNYALALFNQSALLYANDGIPVEISQIFVWDVPSPYSGPSTIDFLHQFQAYRNAFAGDLAHLLGYAGGGGVAASISGLCAANLDYSMCYSGITATFQNVPVYSWSVKVVTHEQGHLLGSRHTHACVWNGNNTAIDGCGPSAGFPYEGGTCSGASLPVNGGTIMSYCHLTSVGVNLSNGFGPQPTAVILNNYNNAGCLTACTGGTFCSVTSNLISSLITTTTATLSWDTVNGATSYIIRYRESGTVSWIIDTITNASYPLTGLIPGTYYEWQIQTICSGGTSQFSGVSTFITVPLICNVPSGLNTSNISSVLALFTWSPVQAAIGYNIQYRIVGSSTWLSANTISSSYQATGLLPNSNYEWQVQTICAGGGTSAYSTIYTFMTLDVGAVVTVTLQPGAECGKDALIGSNVPTGTNIQNYGNNPEFNALAWTAGGSPSNHRALIEYDLSFIPAGSLVQSAYLTLYFNPTSINPGHSITSGPNNSVINKITDAWSETGVTWVNQPSTTTLHQALLPASTSATQNYNNIDVTDLVQDFVNDPLMNYGMMLQLATESSYRSLVFASSDNQDSTIHPKLEVTYAPNITNCVNYQYSNCSGVDATIGNCIVAGYDTSNFGDNPEFDALAWTFSGTNTDLRSLIYWNLSAIPSNAIVNNATMSLYWNPISGNQGHSNQSGPNDAYILKITSPWSENSVTWNNQPAVDTTNQVYILATTSNQQDLSADIKNIVQAWVSNPSSNHGLMLKLATESYFRSRVYCSSDHPDPLRHPKIEICFSIPTDVNEPDRDNNFTLSYNNNTQTAIINFNHLQIQSGKCSLFNSMGKLISEHISLSENQVVYNLQGLASGIYLFNIIYGENIYCGKLLVR
jgi:hypothetical protein